MTFASATKALAASLGAADGRQCFYHRGDLSAEINATAGRTEFETVSDLQVSERVQVRDFIVPAEQLVLGGAYVLPKSGDWIEEITARGNFRYVVAPPVDGVEPYRFCDPHRSILRIHTKETR